MKRYKCECEYALFPWGDGMPICIREWEIQGKNQPVLPFAKNCIEKGCPYYKKKTSILTKTKEDCNEN